MVSTLRNTPARLLCVSKAGGTAFISCEGNALSLVFIEVRSRLRTRVLAGTHYAIDISQSVVSVKSLNRHPDVLHEIALCMADYCPDLSELLAGPSTDLPLSYIIAP